MKTTYYRPEYDELLIKHMSKGMSFASFGGVVNVGRTTLFEWVDRHPTFAEAYKTAKEKAFLFYEKILSAKVSGQDIDGFDPKKSDTACLIFALKTRFRDQYTEAKEINVSGSLHTNILSQLESESE